MRSNRIHKLLLPELLPGAREESSSLLRRPVLCWPPCARVTSSGRTRRQLAAELIAELTTID